jgi:hypothetical protein
MPGFDGTGPGGRGPRTGGGRGFCYPGGRGARPYGYGGVYHPARPWHGYQGFGSWPAAGPYAYGGPAPYAPRWTREQEIEGLQDEAKAIREHLSQIESRIQELESTSG